MGGLTQQIEPIGAGAAIVRTGLNQLSKLADFRISSFRIGREDRRFAEIGLGMIGRSVLKCCYRVSKLKNA
jgi:hypothetical protein